MMLDETPINGGGIDGETADTAVGLAGVVKRFDVTRGLGFVVAGGALYTDALGQYSLLQSWQS